ncbi:MAG TPA: response regulator transcription factor [Gaiellaceae bacterium]|jgi:DNA-binding NarL/FixJ family response regulator|nr:response regulator transcription factor [Gaiellaceae bacterium]
MRRPEQTQPTASRASFATGISVLVVDDHDGFRAGLSVMLADRGFEVVGSAADGRTAVRLVEAVSPDVVLMDLQMPQLNGIETTRRIVESAPATTVVVLTVSAQDDDVLDAMLAGACGYLLKGSSPEALFSGIEAAARGESLISAPVAAKLVARLREDDARRSGDSSPLAFLSARELEILGLLASGRANDDIALQLRISPFTVRNHISNLLRKLEVDNRTQAAAFAIRNGL